MIWYRDLYVGELAEKKKNRIIWKIKHGAGMTDIYLITLASNGVDLLDIFHSSLMLQPAFRKQRPFIVGIARGYEEAVETAARILLQVYQETGDFKVRDDIQRRQKIKR